MEEEKVICTRCNVEISVSVDALVLATKEMQRLGWVDYCTYYGTFGGFTLCPHCIHELNRFLAGCEIKKLSSG